MKGTETGTHHRRRRGRVAVACVGASLAVASSTMLAGQASAIPEYTSPNFVKTIACDSANPWPAAPLKIRVDVYNQIRFPADGLPGPAISLLGSARNQPGPLEFTTEVKVSWKNLRTGRTGVVTVPSRATRVTWQVDLHAGAGPVAFTIRQKIGAMAFVPMVNAQYSTCSGRATA